MTLLMLAPARRSFFFSFFRTLSSVVRKATFCATLLCSGGAKMHRRPLLIAAIRLHHSVVLPIPPSAAIRVICPSGIQPGTSHVASSSSNVSSVLKQDKNGSSSGGAGSHSGVDVASCAIISHAFSSPNFSTKSDTSPCNGMSGHTLERSNKNTRLQTLCNAAAVSWA